MSFRLAIIGGIHEGLTARNGVPDAPFYRIGPTAERRLIQFLRVCKRYKPNAWSLLGDNIHSVADDPDIRVTAIKDTLLSEGLSTVFNVDGFWIAGNHEFGNYDNHLGSPADHGTILHDFWADVSLAYHGVTGTHFWPDSTEKAGWWEDHDGFRLVGLATGESAANWDDGSFGCDAGNNQLDWLRSSAGADPTDGPLDTTNPIIIFAHPWLTSTYVGAESTAVSQVTDANLALVRAEFESPPNTGNVITVFSVHHHEGGVAYPERGIAEIINGIPYFGLEGSIKGRHAYDDASNHFYIFDFETDGKISYKKFGVADMGRERSSVGIIGHGLDFRRGRSDF